LLFEFQNLTTAEEKNGRKYVIYEEIRVETDAIMVAGNQTTMRSILFILSPRRGLNLRRL